MDLLWEKVPEYCSWKNLNMPRFFKTVTLTIYARNFCVGLVIIFRQLHVKPLMDEQSRGATIYAEFLGGSFTSDAYHMTEPHPQGRPLDLL